MILVAWGIRVRDGPRGSGRDKRRGKSTLGIRSQL